METEEEIYTPAQAAKILKLTQARIYQMLGASELEGYQDSESGRWKIPKRAVHALMEGRPAKRSSTAAAADETSRTLADLTGHLRELEQNLIDANRTLGKMEGRLELTEKTESTLREERDRLIKELEREREARERLEARVEHLQQRSWWQRLFNK